jgi:hypothetical protein
MGKYPSEFIPNSNSIEELFFLSFLGANWNNSLYPWQLHRYNIGQSQKREQKPKTSRKA